MNIELDSIAKAFNSINSIHFEPFSVESQPDLGCLTKKDSSGTSGRRKSGSLVSIDDMKRLSARRFHEEPFILVVEPKIQFIYTKPTEKLFYKTKFRPVEEFRSRFGVYKWDFRLYDQNEWLFMKVMGGKTFPTINTNKRTAFPASRGSGTVILHQARQISL